MTDPAQLAMRASRLAEACERAIDRVEARTAAREDVFDELGEALFWLVALTRTNHRSDSPLLSGLTWARNRIAHGVIVAALAGRGGMMVGPGGDLVGPGGGTVGPSAYSWLPVGAIPLSPTERAGAGPQQANYEALVAREPLVSVLRDALALAR